jgi:hypothetical protein
MDSPLGKEANKNNECKFKELLVLKKKNQVKVVRTKDK